METYRIILEDDRTKIEKYLNGIIKEIYYSGELGIGVDISADRMRLIDDNGLSRVINFSQIINQDGAIDIIDWVETKIGEGVFPIAGTGGGSGSNQASDINVVGTNIENSDGTNVQAVLDDFDDAITDLYTDVGELYNSGNIVTYNAGEAISIDDVVMMNGGVVFKYDPTNTSNYNKYIGIAIDGGAIGQPIRIRMHGVHTVGGVLTPDVDYYSDNSGILTSTTPVTGLFHVIGHSINASQLKMFDYDPIELP